MLPNYPLQTAADLAPLLAAIGDARVVLLGEASHGTHEYYTWRTALSKRLVQEKGFQFIAVEGDWPACFAVNTAIKRGQPLPENSATSVLKAFNRWPTWMWGNWEIAALTEWLHQYNHPLGPDQRVGFYGLDVYSLWESLQEILRYVEKQGDGAVATAQRAFKCFEPYGEDPQEYARAVAFVSEDCQREVTRLLADLRQQPGLAQPIGHRAIGVVYRPEFEQYGNYVPSIIPDRYDAFLYLDKTKALHPLPTEPSRHTPPDLYPWGV